MNDELWDSEDPPFYMMDEFDFCHAEDGEHCSQWPECECYIEHEEYVDDVVTRMRKNERRGTSGP